MFVLVFVFEARPGQARVDLSEGLVGRELRGGVEVLGGGLAGHQWGLYRQGQDKDRTMVSGLDRRLAQYSW